MTLAYRITTPILLFVTFILSCIALYFSYTNNFILTYNDAASHLNIARRVIDNLTPGIAQIGTVWLPLPHLLMIPLAINDDLWHTGFAGSIISMAAFIVSVYFTYKTVFTITKSVVGGVIGAAIMALNPNFLYIQTTPMTEPLLIAMFCAAVYFLARYVEHWQVQQLLISSVFVAAATLIRYDGWFLFMFLSALLPLWIWKWRGRHEAESSLILFLFMGGFGIGMWVLWNWMIFGDPLYFVTGPFSAYAQQRVLKSVGQLPTEGDIYIASLYFFWSMVDNNGMILLLSAGIGILIVPFLLKQRRYLITLLAAFSPIIFNTIALYVGQSAMNVPQAPSNPGMFNVRYGMMALPFISLLLGIIAANKYLRYLVILLLLGQSYLFMTSGLPIVLADGLYGKQQTMYTVEAGRWFREHYQGGLILTSLASHDAFVARTQIPMKNYIHEGTRKYWEESTVAPPEYVEYIAALSFPPDSVYRAIHEHPTFKDKYKLIYNYEKFGIYQRIR